MTWAHIIAFACHTCKNTILTTTLYFNVLWQACTLKFCIGINPPIFYCTSLDKDSGWGTRKQPGTHSLTPKDHIEPPVILTCMTLGWDSNPEPHCEAAVPTTILPCCLFMTCLIKPKSGWLRGSCCKCLVHLLYQVNGEGAAPREKCSFWSAVLPVNVSICFDWLFSTAAR